MKYINLIEKNIINKKLCIGCGLCVAEFDKSEAYMNLKDDVPEPFFSKKITRDLKKNYYDACPGKGINYLNLYIDIFNQIPKDWHNGITKNIYVGFSNNNNIRKNSSSGGIITELLIYLLEFLSIFK